MCQRPWDVTPSNNDGPFAVKTILGWVFNGPLELNVQGNSSRQTVTFIKCTASLNEQIVDYFNNDFKEKRIDDRLECSRENKQFLDIMSSSITTKSGH